MVAMIGDTTLIWAHVWSDQVPSDVQVNATASWISAANKHNDRLANVQTYIVPQ